MFQKKKNRTVLEMVLYHTVHSNHMLEIKVTSGEECTRIAVLISKSASILIASKFSEYV